ncbi:MAG: hypothetical protein HYX24_02970 [Candidatus Aenigmarchaeota archaeon]|nr:hypothetical protein [Candidatus Aenigmarchaeota archaeon]
MSNYVARKKNLEDGNTLRQETWTTDSSLGGKRMYNVDLVSGHFVHRFPTDYLVALREEEVNNIYDSIRSRADFERIIAEQKARRE